MRATYGYKIISPEWAWWEYDKLAVRKMWRMMCIPEWWVVREMYDMESKLAGPFKTKQAAEAARMMIEEN